MWDDFMIRLIAFDLDGTLLDTGKGISERAAGRLVDFSRDYHRQHPDVEAFVYGHIHIARLCEAHDGMPPVIFLGEWISLNSYVVMDTQGNFSLRYFVEK